MEFRDRLVQGGAVEHVGSFSEVAMSLVFSRMFKFVIGLGFALIATVPTAAAQDFYKGKTIVLIVGTSAGEDSMPTAACLRATLGNTCREIPVSWFRTCPVPGSS
jgi:hypothetical protein